MSDNRDIVYAVFGFGFGIWSFFWGFKRLRRKRRIENVPTSTVRGLAMGLVELIGKAKKNKLLVSPFTNTECVFYRYTIERYEKRGKSSSWVTIAKGDSYASAFYLEDGTGKVLVLPLGAETILPRDYELNTSWGKTVPSNLVNFLDSHSIRYKSFLGRYPLRFREWYICEDERVYVLGTAKKQRDPLNDYQNRLVKRLDELKSDASKMQEVDSDKDGRISTEEWDRAVANVERGLLEEELRSKSADNSTDVVVTKGEMDDLFMISDHSEKELTKKLGWQAGLGILGGSVLSLLLLVYLVFRLKSLWF
ncbi:GIDE domain-containing protein [Candidatus Omnitrophota bacterium]